MNFYSVNTQSVTKYEYVFSLKNKKKEIKLSNFNQVMAIIKNNEFN